jgi:hypothetical protein|tara:strand:- start:698 stop:1168 length:471 start_codon:yes stop_codon:yes gene_type:complete
MNTIPNFENFDTNETVTAVGFGMGGIQNFGLGGSTPQTGYSMNAIAGTVGQSADAIGAQAHDYEMNDNDDHTAEGYLAEAKKHVNESIDKAYESCKAMNEAMVQIAGKDKPSGAKVLAQVIIADLVEKGYMKLVTNKRELNNMISDVQDIIIKSTF